MSKKIKLILTQEIINEKIHVVVNEAQQLVSPPHGFFKKQDLEMPAADTHGDAIRLDRSPSSTVKPNSVSFESVAGVPKNFSFLKYITERKTTQPLPLCHCETQYLGFHRNL